jgi:hypothetical protein
MVYWHSGRLFCYLLCLFCTVVVVSCRVPGVANTQVMVDYYGRRVPLSVLEVKGSNHCHDAVGLGQLTCFDTVEEVNQDLARRGMLPVPLTLHR